MPTSRSPRPGRPRRVLAAVGVVAVGLAGCTGPGPGSDAPVTDAPATDAPAAATPDATATSASGAPLVEHLLDVPDLHPSVDGYDETRLDITTADGTVHRLAVKVAATPDERSHGLMEVEALPDGTGMWFVFADERQGGFWMYRTLVPLSIAYVGADGAIVSIIDMEPCPPEDGTDCPSYRPDAPYTRALEVPQGWFARVGVVTGDRVREVGG